MSVRGDKLWPKNLLGEYVLLILSDTFLCFRFLHVLTYDFLVFLDFLFSSTVAEHAWSMWTCSDAPRGVTAPEGSRQWRLGETAVERLRKRPGKERPGSYRSRGNWVFSVAHLVACM